MTVHTTQTYDAMSGNTINLEPPEDGYTPLAIDDRSEKAFGILFSHYEVTGNGPRDAAADLISDTLHFLAENHVNLTAVWHQALSNFEHERLEANLPDYEHLDTDPESDTDTQ